MASLVPISGSDITASYHGLGRYLRLTATGDIPEYFLEPFFQREDWLGGLRFSIKAFSGGFGTEDKTKHVDIEHKVQILLPIQHFNNKTVLVETSRGIFKIPIVYIGWPEPEESESAIQAVSKDQPGTEGVAQVLPPIEYWLTDSGKLDINVTLPEAFKFETDISFNDDFLKIVASRVTNGFVTWAFKWAQIPDPSQQTQFVKVTKTIHDGVVTQDLPPKKPVPSIITQQFIIHRAWLVKPN